MTGQHSTGTMEPTMDSGPTDPLAEAGQHATQSAGQLAGRATDIGIQQADRGREMAAEGIDKVARTVRRVSTDMQADQPQIANAALTAADQAEKVAQYLRETDARQMISNVEDLARRQPLLFLGGAFVLGVVASRFVKAAGGVSTDERMAGSQRSVYGSGYRSSESFQPTGTGMRNGGS
jgi:hypothetical protein